MNKSTEWQRVLHAFKQNNNKLSPLDITNKLKINQYGRVISDLRKKGYVITNEFLGNVNGVKHTQFTLVSEPKAYASTPTEKPQNFPSKAHEFAHLNSLNSHKNQDQLTLI